MIRPHFLVRLFIVAGCVAAWLVAPAVADDAILKVIPKNSLAFAVINGLEDADQVFTELGEAIQAPFPNPTMILKQATGLEDSLDMKGNVAVVLYAGDSELQGKPPMLAIVPVVDHKKMLSQFDTEEVSDAIQKITINGAEVLVAEKGGFTVVAQSANQKVLETFLAEKENIAEAMKPWKAWADQNTAYGVFTNHGLKTFMTTGIELLEGTLESFEQAGESNPQLDKGKKALELYVSGMKGIRDNVNQIGVGLSKLESNAVKLSFRCDAISDSELSKMLEQMKALSTDPMAVLPAGSFAFAAGGPIPQKLAAVLIEFSQNMSGGQFGMEGDVSEKITQMSIDSLENLVGQSFTFGVPDAEAKTLIDGLYVAIWAKDADAYLSSYVKQIKEMNDIFAKLEEPPVKMEAEETTIDGMKVVVVTSDMSGIVNEPEMAPLVDFFKILYGNDLSVKGYIAKVSDTLLVSALGSEANLKKAVEIAKSHSGNLADESSVKDVTAMLPKEAQWKMYWSPDGTVDIVNWVLGKLPEELKEQLPFEKVPPFPDSMSVGVAIKVGDGVIEETCIVQPGTIRGAMMYFMQLQMMGAH